MWLIFLMYALTTLPLSSFLLNEISPLFLMGIRLLVAGSLLLLFYYIFIDKIALKKRDYFLLLKVIIFAHIIPYYLRYWALANGSQSTTSLIILLGPIITYLLTSYLTVENFTLLKLAAILVASASYLLCFSPFIFTEFPLNISFLAVLFSVISFCYGWICIQQLVKNESYNPIIINGLSMFPSGLISLFFAYNFNEVCIISLPNITLVAAIIVISNIVTHNLYAYVTRFYSLTFLQLCGLSVPFFLQIRELVIINSIMSLKSLIGLSVILISIWIFNFEKQKSINYHTIE